MRRSSIPVAQALLVALLVVAAAHAAPVTYYIDMQSGGPGTVTPYGVVEVPAGGSQTFTFTPSGACYAVDDVTVDNVSVGAGLTDYTFTNVQADHQVYVSFGPWPTTTALDVRPRVAAVPETLTATVANADSGQVEFFMGGTLLGTRTLASGTATYIIASGLATGTYTLWASYLGTSCSFPSSSPAVGYDIAEGPPIPTFFDAKLWVTDGSVSSIVLDGSTIYIGGYFRQVGPATGGAVAIDASTGVVQQPYPRVSRVLAVAPDGSGGWYLGGSFTSVRGLPRNNLAHLDATGNLTSWNPNANNSVFALTVSGGTVYAGGLFSNIGGQTRNNIAALDAATGEATAWNPSPNPCGDPRFCAVYALAVSGGTVYAGGSFTSIGGQPRNYLAAFDAATGAVTAWNPNANNSVVALAVSGGTVYAGGYFTSIGGQPRSSIAALDAASGAATAWNPDAQLIYYYPPRPYPVVYALAVSGSTVYVGGYFGKIGGLARGGIAAVDATSGAATAWDPSANGDVSALAVSGGTVYAGGSFTNIGGQARNSVAALDATSGVATAWNPNVIGGVYALAVSGGTVYAGGDFTMVGAQARNNIAALDATTGVATSWNPNANNAVDALAVSGGTVYAGGAFTNIGGQARNNIAALDATTGAATAWNPNAQLINPIGGRNLGVAALVVSGGTVYAGGSFNVIGGQPRNNLAALDATTGAATAWDPNVQWPDATGPTVDVYTLAVSGGTVYAGGIFSDVGGQPRNSLAAIDATTGAVTSWDPNVGPHDAYSRGSVNTLVVSDGTVYAGGIFSDIGGQPRNNVAAINAATGAATPWNPNASGVLDYVFPAIFSIAVSSDRVYVGGNFTRIGGKPRLGIAALGMASGAALPWNVDTNGSVLTLALGGGVIYAGGVFTSIGGLPQPDIAAISRGSPTAAPVNRETPSRGDLVLLSSNPTSGGARVQYDVARTGRVRLEVLDVSGRVEESLADRVHTPGRYVVAWDGAGRRGRPSPGLYFIRLVAPGGQVTTRKLAIIR